MVFIESKVAKCDPNDNSMLDMLIGYSCIQTRILLLLLLLLLLLSKESTWCFLYF